MRRWQFHRRRFVISLAIVFGGFVLMVAVILLVPGESVAGVSAFGYLVGLLGALFILPAWVMQPDPTSPPPGRGRTPQPGVTPLASRRRTREQTHQPPTDLAARVLGGLAAH
jgi:hypothetical protein